MKALVFVIALALYASFSFADLQRPYVGNEQSHILLLAALTLAESVELTDAEAPELLDETDISTRDGRIYSNKPPGLPALVWPLMEIITVVDPTTVIPTAAFVLAIQAFNSIVAALSVVLIYLYLSSFRLSPASVWFGVLAAAIGTLAPVYAAQASSAALSLFLTLAVLVCLRRHQTHSSTAWLIVAPGLMALAFAVDYKTAAFLLPAATVAAWALLRTDTRFIVATAGLTMIPLAALAAYNLTAFDTVLTLTYSHYEPDDHVAWDGVGNAFSLAYFPEAAWGLTLGTARGMMPISPVVALGILGAVVAWRRDLVGKKLPIAMAICGLLFMCSYIYWFGGHSVGYRHVLITAVLLAMLSAFAVDAAKAHKTAIAGCLLVLLFSAFTSYGSWMIQRDETLLNATWLEEQGRAQADFFGDLLIPCLTRDDLCE